ncbi:hypothetical protein B0H11DRAFT_2326967 [Mycena galericulata]|nr:hypothetical protein B0H11DRAFT_2326967 [Mycena galericulata]
MPIIIIFGATGTHGSSVLVATLADGKHTPRAVTRIVDSDASKALIAQGVEVLFEKTSIVKAIQGSEVMFRPPPLNRWSANAHARGHRAPDDDAATQRCVAGGQSVEEVFGALSLFRALPSSLLSFFITFPPLTTDSSPSSFNHPAATSSNTCLVPVPPSPRSCCGYVPPRPSLSALSCRPFSLPIIVVLSFFLLVPTFLSLLPVLASFLLISLSLPSSSLSMPLLTSSFPQYIMCTGTGSGSTSAASVPQQQLLPQRQWAFRPSLTG